MRMRAGLIRLQRSVQSLEHSDGTDGHGHVREIDTQKELGHRGKNGLLLCPQTVEWAEGELRNATNTRPVFPTTNFQDSTKNTSSPHIVRIEPANNETNSVIPRNTTPSRPPRNIPWVDKNLQIPPLSLTDAESTS